MDLAFVPYFDTGFRERLNDNELMTKLIPMCHYISNRIIVHRGNHSMIPVRRVVAKYDPWWMGRRFCSLLKYRPEDGGEPADENYSVTAMLTFLGLVDELHAPFTDERVFEAYVGRIWDMTRSSNMAEAFAGVFSGLAFVDQ